MNLFDVVYDFCLRYQSGKTYWIAYSGGLDSHVLLSICREVQEKVPVIFRAIHIDHGLNNKSNDWANHCAKICEAYQISFVIEKICIERTKGLSLESLAREKRYACLAKHLNEGDILLTAHHQDDQAETLLLQLLRGSGLKGLSAMPMFKSFAKGYHGRPFLNFTRTQLQDYATEHSLCYINDESNHETQLTRNFIRHEVLPQLKKRWKTISRTIARVANHCAEAQSLLDDYAMQLLEQLRNKDLNTLSVKKLLELKPEKQKLVLRMWISNSQHVVPETKKLNTILNTVLTAASDRIPAACWPGSEVRRYQDHLYLLHTLPKHDASQIFEWNFKHPLHLSGNRILSVRRMPSIGLRTDINQASIRFRQGGEKIRLHGRRCHTLKNLFHEWHVPPWERPRIPLIFVKEQLIGVLGHYIHPNFVAKEGEIGLELFLESMPSH